MPATEGIQTLDVLDAARRSALEKVVVALSRVPVPWRRKRPKPAGVGRFLRGYGQENSSAESAGYSSLLFEKVLQFLK